MSELNVRIGLATIGVYGVDRVALVIVSATQEARHLAGHGPQGRSSFPPSETVQEFRQRLSNRQVGDKMGRTTPAYDEIGGNKKRDADRN